MRTYDPMADPDDPRLGGFSNRHARYTQLDHDVHRTLVSQVDALEVSSPLGNSKANAREALRVVQAVELLARPSSETSSRSSSLRRTERRLALCPRAFPYAETSFPRRTRY